MSETTAQLEYRLLTEFQRLFEGTVYKHRNSSQGDFVAMHLYEDLVAINRSSKLAEAAIHRRDRVVNVQNRLRGVRRGEATGLSANLYRAHLHLWNPGYRVARGPVATVEIGIEVKILAKAMIKQIDRVVNDLRNQANQFKRGGGQPISVAVIGINQADSTVSYEGERPFPTTGRQGFLHPFQEAPEAERRLLSEAAAEFDEFVILRFKASNAPPYLFEWVNYRETRLDYAAALSRIAARYQQRF